MGETSFFKWLSAGGERSPDGLCEMNKRRKNVLSLLDFVLIKLEKDTSYYVTHIYKLWARGQTHTDKVGNDRDKSLGIFSLIVQLFRRLPASCLSTNSSISDLLRIACSKYCLIKTPSRTWTQWMKGTKQRKGNVNLTVQRKSTWEEGGVGHFLSPKREINCRKVLENSTLLLWHSRNICLFSTVVVTVESIESSCFLVYVSLFVDTQSIVRPEQST